MKNIKKVIENTNHPRHKHHAFLNKYSRADIAQNLGVSRNYVNAVLGGCRKSRVLNIRIDALVKYLRTQEEGCKADA